MAEGGEESGTVGAVDVDLELAGGDHVADAVGQGAGGVERARRTRMAAPTRRPELRVTRNS
ncbi:hypothetical protein H480_21967 [Amycolatopsis vancoresmycina DSM 44592]|uniref:Uncharacterized protein n=1 Tax=Amycolatopsis vancoresmycina DSM 44592 TaxID=1292037 RepID=R1HRY9_9PSEU|nr:hypothetical protein H480_21967 [Amycolatopsis vancoresmycina DSM 44592]